MKIRALETFNTIKPEKHWEKGKEYDIDERESEVLLATGKFEIVNKIKRSDKKNKIKK